MSRGTQHSAVFDNFPKLSLMLRCGIQAASSVLEAGRNTRGNQKAERKRLYISKTLKEEKCQTSFDSHFQAED